MFTDLGEDDSNRREFMFKTLYCVSHEHNVWLLGLAAVVCLVATSTALQLMILGFGRAGAARSLLLMGGGACGGAGTWATHFIAMLAFDPGVATGYNVSGTAQSLLIIVASGAAGVLATTLTARRWRTPVWGAIFCLGVGGMHYMGMAAMKVAGTLSWDPAYVASSLTIGSLFAMLSLNLAFRAKNLLTFLSASVCMALAVCTLHFIAMAAVTIHPDASVRIPQSNIPHNVMALYVAALTILIAAVGLIVVWVQARAHRSSLRLLQQIIGATPQALAYFDADDRFVFGNAAYHREAAFIGSAVIKGLPYREILAYAAAAQDPPATAEQNQRWLEDRLRERLGSSSSFDQKMADGRFLRVQSNRTPVGGIVTVISDITGLMRQADDLKTARDLSEAATLAKSTFLATMSHEIRTPLNGVLGMAQAMAFDELSPQQSDRLKVIRESGEALLTILNDVLDISKIEAGKLALESSEFDLSEIAVGVYATFATLVDHGDLTFDLDLKPRAEGRYNGDPVRIRQVLSNLIANAIKFTRQGSVTVTIDYVAGALHVEVVDTGIGMTPEQAKSLFQRFVQADASITRRFGGSGLGLAICNELVELMGGSLTVDTRLGEGSTFRVCIPINRLEGDEAPKGIAPVEAEVFDLRVLAAEDNKTNQLVLKTLLGHVGITPKIVENGAEALEAWSSGSWDLILMDVQMPGMGGPEATRIIRDRERAEGRFRTPIIALTANAMAHHITEYLDAGMDGHVPKPIETKQLFATIEAILASPSDPCPIVSEAAA